MFPFLRAEETDRRQEIEREITFIELTTRRAPRNSLMGEHRSRLRGEGLEFIEHKKYIPGDNYRRIDWNVMARTRQPYVKICHEDKEIAALIIADLSRSMEMGSQRFSKREVLIEAVATLAFSATEANIAVGLVAGGDSVELYYPPKKGKADIWRFLDVLLDHRSPPTRTDLKPLLKFGMEKLKHPSLVLFLSDFIDMEPTLSDSSLTHMVSYHDLVPIIIEDPMEQDMPPLGGILRLRDLEGGKDRLLSLSRSNCEIYSRSMKERRKSILKAFLRMGVIPITLCTGHSPLQPLMKFFLQLRKGKQ